MDKQKRLVEIIENHKKFNEQTCIVISHIRKYINNRFVRALLIKNIVEFTIRKRSIMERDLRLLRNYNTRLMIIER